MRTPSPAIFALASLSVLSAPACAKSPLCEDANCLAVETGTEDSSGDGDGDPGGDGDPDTGDGDGDSAGSCAGDAPIVVLETTLGTMVVELDAILAPVTVDNFIAYVEAGFYDNTIFHRVLDNFVIQGGGYGPGLTVKETMGTIPLEIHPELRHVDGALAMARRAEPDTAESQWYICDGAQPGLDDDYAVFGVLIDGWDVRNAISSVTTTTVPVMGGEFTDVPAEDVVVTSAYCVEDWP